MSTEKDVRELVIVSEIAQLVGRAFTMYNKTTGEASGLDSQVILNYVDDEIAQLAGDMIAKAAVKQTTGISETDVMSQKITSDNFAAAERNSNAEAILFERQNLLIWRITENGHTGGDIAGSGGYAISNMISLSDIYKIIFRVQNSGTVAAIAYYDINGAYISGLTNYPIANTNTILRESFPAGATHIRFCMQTDEQAYIDNAFVNIYHSALLRDKITEIKEETSGIPIINAKLNEWNIPFSYDLRLIWYATESGHTAGSEAWSEGYMSTDFIKINDAEKIEAYIQNFGTVAAIAYYDENRAFISAITNYDLELHTILAESFPLGSVYARFCAIYTAETKDDCYVKIYKDINVIESLNSIDNDRFILNSPNEKYWAVCGDSITNANHGNIYDIEETDPYLPIDGYQDLNTYKRKNYAYYIAKENKLKWANYGYGGTTLHHCAPKAYSNMYFYPFVDTRIETLKPGIEWDYITLLFGWNDCAFGAIYQRDLWLQETYNQDIGYPATAEQIGAQGFATQIQKDACDAATGSVGGIQYNNNNDYFFAKFIGTIDDNTKNTWLGAWNYALDYLIKKYQNAKIMIFAPYVSGYSEMVRTSVKNIASKFGVLYFDFEDIPYWYYSTIKKTTELKNPNDINGYWYTENNTQCEPNISGYNQSRFSYDTLHPSNLGYKAMSKPIGNKLING